MIVSAFLCAAVLSWGLAAAAPAAHGAMPGSMSQSAQNHAYDNVHDRGHAAQAADACNTTNDQTNSNPDRCCPPGCSFAVMTPVPFGAVVRVIASAPAAMPDSVAPDGGAAPPLRPPRLS